MLSRTLAPPFDAKPGGGAPLHPFRRAVAVGLSGDALPGRRRLSPRRAQPRRCARGSPSRRPTPLRRSRRRACAGALRRSAVPQPLAWSGARLQATAANSGRFATTWSRSHRTDRLVFQGPMHFLWAASNPVAPTTPLSASAESSRWGERAAPPKPPSGMGRRGGLVAASIRGARRRWLLAPRAKLRTPRSRADRGRAVGECRNEGPFAGLRGELRRHFASSKGEASPVAGLWPHARSGPDGQLGGPPSDRYRRDSEPTKQPGAPPGSSDG